MGLENSMPEGWVETTLGDLMADKGYIRGPFGSALKRGEMLDHGVPVYEQANAIYNHRKFRYFISSDKHLTLYRFTVKPNDILISCSGTFGKTTIINEDDPKGIISQALLILRSNPQKIDTYYLNYFLNSREGKIKLAGMSHGSVQVNIAKRADVESIEFLLPPLPEQKAIAKVLTAFDDKIELLQAQNKTLETMAQTIFKEWFGKYQVGDELPEGWRVGKLGEELKIIMGQSPSGSSYNELGEGDVFFQGRAEFTSRFPSVRLFTTEPKRMASKFDVLVSVRAPVGDINVAHTNCCIGRGLAAVSSENKSYSLYKLKHLKPIFDLFESEGTVFGSINKRSFESIETIIPKIDRVKEFNDHIKSTDLKIYENYNQIQSLTKTRDTLLPKLMSGQIRVNNIKQTADA